MENILALSIGVTRGSRIRVGQSMVKVEEIVQDVAVTLSVDGGKKFMITDSERTQIIPEVFVQLGLNHRSSGTNSSRLAFEAPFSIKINRIRQ
jgi:hypothetical protein